MIIKTLCVDISKSVFHTLGFDKNRNQVYKRKFSRKGFVEFLHKLSPCDIVLEACGTSHHWARTLRNIGHTPFLITARRVKQFVNAEEKNDYNDTLGIFCAYSQPSTKFVSIKSEEGQSLTFIHRSRSRLIRNRTQLLNQTRAFLHELGLVVPLGRSSLIKKVYELLETTNDLMRITLNEFLEELSQIQIHITQLEQVLNSFVKNSPPARRLMEIPGIGIITATAMLCEVADFSIFKSGREFSAWLGCVPRQNTTGGKTSLGSITKAGNPYLRKLLVQGANAVASSLKRNKKQGRAEHKPIQWMEDLLKRHPQRNKVCVAMANKLARIIWALMVHDKNYDKQHVSLPPNQYQKTSVAG